MQLHSNGYTLRFAAGGLAVYKADKRLYYNQRPMYVYLKTLLTITEFYDAPYAEVKQTDNGISATGILQTPTGAAFEFHDTYIPSDTGFQVQRTAQVLKKSDDLGFATKLSLTMAESDRMQDYDCFAPANWYKQNEFAPPFVMGKDLDSEYFWRRETNFTLPLFAAQNKGSGESVTLSRWSADIAMRSLDFEQSEHVADPKFSIGSIGMSKQTNRTLNVLYYGYELRTDIETEPQGLSIDYVYPGVDGQLPPQGQGYHVDYAKRSKTMTRVYHPMEEGFSHRFAVGIDFDRHDGFYPMMRSTWRRVYSRLRDPLFKVDHKLHYRNNMEALTKLTRQYGDAWGLPFACQLPQMDVSSVSFQFGFVGQQPGIGYQLIRYGLSESRQEAYEKGIHILDFWTQTAMTDIGAPMVCYSPALAGFEPMPFWTRMIADGLENILDAYVYLRKHGTERPEWLDFCRRSALWLVRIQNQDGSYYRAYNTHDGSMRMESKGNTISVVRFLIQYYLVTGDESCKKAALRAGDWAYENTYQDMAYHGSTCDNADIMDNESGIYAMFGFLALYDLTADQKWLDALMGAADYTETWTYSWSFPVQVRWPNHPFIKNAISGQSPVTIGGGGGDMYMAACAYLYYRLYLITGDDHYRDYAEFIHNNTRQANDVDGSFGFAYPGLSHEGASFGSQILTGHFHWLPWVTYVEVDPVSRLLDTFDAYDIAGAQQLPLEERQNRNRIYAHYADLHMPEDLS